MNTIELKVPAVGESVSEVEVGQWRKREGDPVRLDETVVILETDKATVEIPSPVTGHLVRIVQPNGARVTVGAVLGHMTAAAPDTAAPDTAVAPPAAAGEIAAAAPAAGPPRVMPSAARLMAEKGIPAEHVQPTGPGGRVLKEDVQRAAAPGPAGPPAGPGSDGARAEEVVPMSLFRRTIAERLVQAQRNAALLTTFNEIDMSAASALRREFQDRFRERYGVKLGFMGFFVKATIEALKDAPALNAEIRGTDIVYRNYHDLGIAIGGGRGLVVPILRNAATLSFAEIEQAIADFARRARENTLRPDDLRGGTFTLTNGGVYGSLLSTPLLNPPQSGVLGMHAIQDRPVAHQGQVVIRPMMYVALTYDHRLVDGREAVTFLRRVKDVVENPARLLLEI